MHAAQRADAAEMGDGARATAGRLHDFFRLDVETVRQWAAHRDPHDVFTRALDAVRRRRAPVVVHADDCGAVPLHPSDQPLLHGSVVAQCPVPVEMVLADIDENTNRGIERRRQIDLIGRRFDHVDAPGARRVEAERIAVPILPPTWVSWPAQCMRCAISAVVVDFPLVPVTATNGDRGAWRRLSRQNSSMSPIDFNRGCACQSDQPMRSGMGERHSRSEHKRRNARPFDMTQIGGRHARPRRLRNDIRIVVPGDHVSPAGQKRTRARKPRVSQSEDRDFLSGKSRDGDHAAITAA